MSVSLPSYFHELLLRYFALRYGEPQEQKVCHSYLAIQIRISNNDNKAIVQGRSSECLKGGMHKLAHMSEHWRCVNLCLLRHARTVSDTSVVCCKKNLICWHHAWYANLRATFHFSVQSTPKCKPLSRVRNWQAKQWETNKVLPYTLQTYLQWSWAMDWANHSDARLQV